MAETEFCLIRYAEQALTHGDFSVSHREVLQTYIRNVSQSPRLLARAEAYYEALFGASADTTKPTEVCEADDEESGALFVVLYLARLAALPEAFTARGIPAEYAAGAAWHYRDLLERNLRCYGSYGFRGMYRDGAWGYLRPTRLTLGRLNFEPGRFHAPYRVYQSVEDGRLLPVAKAGVCYLSDGRQRPKGSDAPCALQTTCDVHDGVIEGYTFDEDGRLCFEPIRLEVSRWQPVLSEGDDVLWVHIPSNGPLGAEAVEESLQQAKAFFARYFPKTPYRAFVCSSWLLDTGLRAHLKPDSNILAFQKRFHIVLSHVNRMALYWNVFGVETECPLSALVPRNALQSGLLRAAEVGNPLYSGNGFWMLSDLPHGDWKEK